MMDASSRLPDRARWPGLLALVVLLGACGQAHVVQREPDYGASPRAAPASRHADHGEVEVIRGDTLYAIAFRNGMDFRDLAAINGIEPPYTIYVGQVLKLRGGHAHVPTSAQPVVQAPPHPVRVVPPASTAPAPRPVRPVPQPSANPVATTPASTASPPAPTPFETVPAESAKPDAVPPAQTVPASTQPAAIPPIPTPQPPRVATATVPSQPMPPRVQAPPVPVQPTPTQPAQVAPTPAPRIAPTPTPTPAPAVVRTPSAAILPADVATVGGVRWRWPAKGTLLDRFMAGDATKQGVDIGGNAGDPVFAASDGVVVYSGSGLVGYGELIIIKHSDEWLSAYGHNRKRLVQEGQRVKAGQPIAEMGNSGAPRDELHFEIRRNGKPVDPLQYLPQK